MTNALIIAITAHFTPFNVYSYGGYRPENLTGLQGYVNWSLSPFYIDSLLDGEAFPAVSAQQLVLIDDIGNSLKENNGIPYMANNTDGDGSSDLLYLPYADVGCLIREGVSTSYIDSHGRMRARFFVVNVTIEGELQMNVSFSEDSWEDFYRNENVSLLYNITGDNGGPLFNRSPRRQSFGLCFNKRNHTCR